MARTLTRAQLKVRMLRALSGLSQEDFERSTQVPNIGGMEKGDRHPTAVQIARMCEVLNITTDDSEMLLQDYEARVARYKASGATGSEPPLTMPAKTPGIAAIVEEAEIRLGRAGEEHAAARAAEREQARGPWERLKKLESFDEMVLVARSAKEFQTWAVVELICDETREMVSAAGGGDRDSAERARNLAELAVEISGRIRAVDAWRTRLRGYAMAHLANAQSAAGDVDTARETMEEAERLWESGQDPEQILDPGRFHDLEASISFSDAN